MTTRMCLILVFALTLITTPTRAIAEGNDNVLFRKILGERLKTELSKRDCKDRAWYSKHVKEGKESESWLWLTDPQQNLTITVDRCDLIDGKLHFEIAAESKAAFEAKGKIRRVFKGDVKGSSRVRLQIGGAATVDAEGRLQATEISKLKGELHDVRFNNDLLKAAQGLIRDALNGYIQANQEPLRREIADALNGQSIL